MRLYLYKYFLIHVTNTYILSKFTELKDYNNIWLKILSNSKLAI